MRDALKSYLALAGGVTELTRQRAVSAAKALVNQGEATAEQVGGLAEDLLAQTRQNREAVVALVSFEVDRAMARVGLATSEEVVQLTDRVRDLEKQLRATTAAAAAQLAAVVGGGRAPSASPRASAQGAPAKTGTTGELAGAGARAAGTKAPAKRATAKRAPATKAPAKNATAEKAPAKKAPAKKAPAKKAPADKATAGKATAKRAPAKKAPAKTAPAADPTSSTSTQSEGTSPA